jgi:hypothetical protein
MASPRSPVGAAGDEAIWRKLREAGFDEESVRRLDKAKLIGYISRIESEVPHSTPLRSLALRFECDAVLAYGGVVFLGVSFWEEEKDD